MSGIGTTSKIAILCVAILMLAGCADEQRREEGESEQSTVEYGVQDASAQTRLRPGSNHVSWRINENTFVDAAVNVPAETVVPVVAVSLGEFDEAMVKTALFGRVATSSEEVGQGQWVTRSVDGGRSCAYFTGARHSALMFRTDWVEPILGVIQLGFDEDHNNLSRFSSDAELSFASRDEAVQVVRDTVELLGVHNSANAAVWAIDHATLEAVEDQMKVSGEHEEHAFKDAWSVEDDSYFVRLECVVDGLAVDTRDAVTMAEQQMNPGSRVVAIVSPRGLEYLEVSNCYAIESVGTSRPILSAEDAIGTVATKLSELITSTTYTISEVVLRYVPVFADSEQTQLHLSPAWCVTVVEAGQDQSKQTQVSNVLRIRLDAYTGEEL